MVKPLEIGVSRYEFAVFLDDIIVEVFRTDSEQGQSAMFSEATKRAEYLKNEYANRIYKVDKLPRVIRQ
jgi:hypothetical protein